MGTAPDYKLLFEKSPVPLLVLDPDLSIIAVSDAYLQATGREKNDLLGKHIFVAFPDNPDDPSADGVRKLNLSLQKVLRDKVPDAMAIQKYDIQTSAGGNGFEKRYWNPQNVPVLSENGDLLYIIHRVEDVTELLANNDSREEARLQELTRNMAISVLDNNKEIDRKNQQLSAVNLELTKRTEELKRSNDELASFASVASHDIQAPFRVVGNYLGMIEDKVMNTSLHNELSPFFERIYKARQRISSLLEDLLSFAMVTSAEREEEDINTEQVVQEVLQNLEMVIREKDAKVTVHGPLPVIKGESTHVAQLFQNLIGNALTYNKGRPEINVACTREKHFYKFSISDNGLGIEAEHLEKIFLVFQRLYSREEFPGTGLGLAICKRVVEQLGGTIWVESRPGKGSTFYFTVPLGR
jgi:PAS domain S-box-containing protein